MTPADAQQLLDGFHAAANDRDLRIARLQARRRAINRAMDWLADSMRDCPDEDWTWLHDRGVDLQLELLDRRTTVNLQINALFAEWASSLRLGGAR